MKLLALEIGNFQSHRVSSLGFSPGLNIIVGSTNSGKSSIVRALKKVFQDFPRGLEFITHTKEECKLQLSLENHDVVTRYIKVRNENLSHNEFSLNGTQFFNFGSAIPIEIRQVLCNLNAEITEELGDVRFGNQLDPPFLLSLTPSGRARALSQISGVDILDKGAKIANQKVRTATREGERCAEEIGQLETQLIWFVQLPQWEEQLQQSKHLFRKVTELQTVREKLSLVVERLRVTNRIIADVERVQFEDCPMLQMKDQLQKLDATFNHQKYLWKTLDRLQSLNLQLSALRNSVLLFDRYDFTTLLSELEKKWKSWRTILNIYTSFRTMAQAFTEGGGKLKTAADSLKQSVQELQTFKAALKVCPICERPF